MKYLLITLSHSFFGEQSSTIRHCCTPYTLKLVFITDFDISGIAPVNTSEKESAL